MVFLFRVTPFSAINIFYYVTDIYGPGNVLNTAQSSRCFQRAFLFYVPGGEGGTEKTHFHAEWLYYWSGKAALDWWINFR